MNEAEDEHDAEASSRKRAKEVFHNLNDFFSKSLIF
jgi:hypothetical protein